MKGVICKVECRIKNDILIAKFKKDFLYSIVKHGNRWWLVNHEEKKRFAISGRKFIANMRKCFIPYQPIKRKSKYEKWEKKS